MKRLLRVFLFSLFALFVTSNLVGGLEVGDDPQTYVAGAAALAFLYLFIKPILRLLFLPVNLASLGLLSWVVNVAVLYLLTMIIPKIKITAWDFPGYSYQGFAIPPYSLSPTATFVFVSLTLSIIINFLLWLSR